MVYIWWDFQGQDKLHCSDSLILFYTTRLRLDGTGDERLTVLADNLPGNPDNLRNSSSGGYWVALTAVRDGAQGRPIWEELGTYPRVRDIVCKLYKAWTSDTVKYIRNMVSVVKCTL